MSRIYDNKPLEALPVLNIQWDKSWQESQHSSEGTGVLLEGTIQKRSRISITDAQNKKYRYFLLNIAIDKAHNRQFDSNGKEIEPNFGDTEKVRTGFLNSSYKTAAKGVSDRLNPCTTKTKIEKRELLDLQKERVGEKNVVLWLNETKTDSIQIDDGDKFRIKTVKDSPFVETIGRLDAVSSTVSNYAGGEQAGASWTDKVMVVKSQTANAAPSGGAADGDGADDDEWDD